MEVRLNMDLDINKFAGLGRRIDKAMLNTVVMVADEIVKYAKENHDYIDRNSGTPGLTKSIAWKPLQSAPSNANTQVQIFASSLSKYGKHEDYASFIEDGTRGRRTIPGKIKKKTGRPKTKGINGIKPRKFIYNALEAVTRMDAKRIMNEEIDKALDMSFRATRD